MYTFSETLQSFNELYSVASKPLNCPPSPRLAGCASQDISFYPTTTYGPSMIPHYATFGTADMGIPNSDPNFPEFADLAEFAQSRVFGVSDAFRRIVPSLRLIHIQEHTGLLFET